MVCLTLESVCWAGVNVSYPLSSSQRVISSQIFIRTTLFAPSEEATSALRQKALVGTLSE